MNSFYLHLSLHLGILSALTWLGDRRGIWPKAKLDW